MSGIYIKESLNELASVIKQYDNVFAIIDNNLKPYCTYFDNLNTIWISTSEREKSLERVSELTKSLIGMGADRGAFIIGVGGGITTDLVGFLASTYKRGVKFGFVPTTLLAQVDASIGGKNGVNVDSYKNMLGTITQPEWIYICPDMLKSLNPREFKAGIAEVLKTFILFDREYYHIAVEYFAELEELLDRSGSYSVDGLFYKLPLLTEIIGRCAKYKCGVVERDEFEKGERRLLNLGHSFAHSIEKICGESSEYAINRECSGIMHGEAVSIGTLLAARMAVKMGRAEEAFAEMIECDLRRVGLPVSVPSHIETGESIPMAELVAILKTDKKVSGESIHFILPEGLECVKDIMINLKELEEIACDLC